MNETESLERMVPPGKMRANKAQMLGGVLQIMITRACNESCYNCTQGSNLGGKPVMMTVEQFEQACISLKDYFGVVGVFGGNPATHPHFDKICEVMRKYIPANQRGLWCNHPMGKGKIMRETFNPLRCNLNVHMSVEAWDEFRRDWPESRPFGKDGDARHAPCYVSMKDMGIEESERWKLISGCDINQHWSALIGVFRGKLRGWFCEVAAAQSMLHSSNPDYPDTGVPIVSTTGDQIAHEYNGAYYQWWQLPMFSFREQVRVHCHDCGVPLRGHGELALSRDENSREQVSAAHQSIYKSKTSGRRVELVTVKEQLGEPLHTTVDYMGNAKKYN